MHSPVPLVWFNEEGGRAVSGHVLPTGWLWLCACGSSGMGYRSQLGAETAALVHIETDSYVYTWLGDTPDELIDATRQRGALARVHYVWGGMAWNVTVVPSPDRTLRDADGRRPFVRLVWGDVVTITGYEPNVVALVWRPTSDELFG